MDTDKQLFLLNSLLPQSKDKENEQVKGNVEELYFSSQSSELNFDDDDDMAIEGDSQDAMDEETKDDNFEEGPFIEEDVMDDVWKEINQWTRAQPECTRKGGPILPEGCTLDPLSLFKLFFDDEVFEQLVIWTNKYAQYTIDEKMKKLKNSTSCQRHQFWRETNIFEMKKYLSLVIAFGIHSNAIVKDNWANDELLATNFGKYMSRNRFLLIHKYFHASDPFAETDSKLSKVKPLADLIESKWKKFFYPYQNLSMDESIIPFNGRLSFKQDSVMKPTRHGIKTHVLSDSLTGYALSCDVWLGRTEDESRIDSGDLADKLTKGLEHANHHLFCDKDLSTLDLSENLKEKGIYFTGSVTEDGKGLPKILKQLRLQKNELRYFRKEDLVLMAWKPKRKMLMLSNFGNATKKKVHTATGEVVYERPDIAQSYSKYVNGVERTNRMCSYYRFPHRSIKWWRTLFYFYLEVCLNNAFVIYKNDGHGKASTKEFRIQLVHDLIKEGEVFESISSQINLLERKKHVPQVLDKKFVENEEMRPCRVCKNKTNFFCTKCTYKANKFIMCCLPDCFREFHLDKEC